MAQQSAEIVREVHDEPHIAGSRITVQFIHERVEGLGLDPAHVADQHGLDVADVYRALAYYHENSDEMAAVADRRQTAVDAAAADPEVVTGPEDLDR